MGGGLVGNLLGKALGKVVQSALGAVGEQMRQAQAQVADVLNRAQVRASFPGCFLGGDV